MIQANDLRIGNLVIGNHDYVKIEAITSDIVSVSGYNTNRFTPFKIEHIEPIPLTEEILLKCGFGIESFIQENDVLLIDVDEGIRIGYCGFLFIEVNGSVIYLKDCTMDKLHHLQNLYFALTSKELEITL